MTEIRYAGYPSVVMYEQPAGEKRKAIQQLLWGDSVELLAGEPEGALGGPAQPAPQGWLRVRARQKTGWLRESDLQASSVLEVTWVDVGQGDSTVIVTPDNRIVLVDAGQEDNLFRYLRWRFGLASDITFNVVVLSHSDEDHYGGFGPLFAVPGVHVGRFVHNGLVQRPNGGLGRAVEGPAGTAQVDLVSSDADLDALIGADPGAGGYLGLLGSIRGHRWPTQMLDSAAGRLPGFDSGDPTIEVLSPIVDCLPDGTRSLPSFGADGRTRNGNSIVLMVRYGKLRLFLGGDLHAAAQKRLLQHAAPRPELVFGADVAKACHHGGPDVLDAFLEASKPVATVISSGDDEGYSHPRPDVLGAIGKHSRGVRPLIFSTELARSSHRRVGSPAQEKKRVEAIVTKERQPRPDETSETAQARWAAEAQRRTEKVFDRRVARYGAVQLRSDGERVLMGMKLEHWRSEGNQWDLYKLERRQVRELGREDWVYVD